MLQRLAISLINFFTAITLICGALSVAIIAFALLSIASGGQPEVFSFVVAACFIVVPYCLTATLHRAFELSQYAEKYKNTGT